MAVVLAKPYRPSGETVLSLGRHPDAQPPGRVGVRTHGSLGILLGTAAYRRTRRALVAEMRDLALRRGPYADSAERLTPVLEDPLSAPPLGMVAARALLSPASAVRLAGATVRKYSVTVEAIQEACTG